MHSYQISTFAPVTPALLTQQNNPIVLDAELSNFQTQLESLIRPYEKQLTPGQNIVMAEVHSNFIYPNQKIIFKNILLSFPPNETQKEVSFHDRIIFDNCTWHSEGNVFIASGTLTAEISDEENSSKKVKISLTANGPDAIVAGVGSSKGTQITLAAATANARAIGLSPNISVIQKHPEAFCKKTVLIDDVEELIEAPTMAYAAWQKTQTGHLTSKVKTMSSPSSAQGARNISLNTAQVTIISPADKSKQFKISRKQEEKSRAVPLKIN